MRHGFAAATALVLVAAAAAADDAPATLVAKKEDVVFRVEAAGVFDAKAPVEVAARTQIWSDELEIDEVAVECSQGGMVNQGTVLVRFKTEKIDDAVAAGERDLAVAKAALAVQTEDRARTLAGAAVALARVEFEAKSAQELLDRFEKTDMPLRIEESEHGLQGTRNWIADQTEEYAQLEKMYKADDLVEATEEIVLKRAKRELDRAKKTLEFQTRRDVMLRESDLPREHEGLRLEARRTATERDKALAVSKLQEAQSRLELDRAAAGVASQERNLAKLKADRERFTVTSPERGLAVPGSLVRGRWQNIDEMRKALKKGGRFHGQDVLCTIVQPATRVVATVPESSAWALQIGQKARIAPGAAGRGPIDATVAYESTAGAGNDAEAWLDLATPDPLIFPGATCRVRIDVGARSTLMLPSAAVEDGFEKAVYVVADGKRERRVVRTGATMDGRIEIVAGLSEGETVLAAAPKK